jgi:hypothetical protein
MMAKNSGGGLGLSQAELIVLVAGVGLIGWWVYSKLPSTAQLPAAASNAGQAVGSAAVNAVVGVGAGAAAAIGAASSGVTGSITDWLTSGNNGFNQPLPTTTTDGTTGPSVSTDNAPLGLGM